MHRFEPSLAAPAGATGLSTVAAGSAPTGVSRTVEVLLPPASANPGSAPPSASALTSDQHHQALLQAAVANEEKNGLLRQLEELKAQDSARREELAELRERVRHGGGAGAIEAVEQAHKFEIVSRDERHAASLEALRQVHREELASYKQRAMDAKQLESIENKVKDTVGQLMLLQAQMADRAAGLDVAHDAQIDARHRLIEDMEVSARSTHQQAEHEVVKLQALLSSMDTVMRSMRSLSLEEHERLNKEHERLDMLQDATKVEAVRLRETLAEERKLLTERQASHEAERRAFESTVDERTNKLDAAAAALTQERAQFASLQAKAARAASEKEEQMAQKDKALRELGEQIEQQAAALDERVAAARRQIDEAEARERELAEREGTVASEMSRVVAMHAHVDAIATGLSEREAQAAAALNEARSVRDEAANASAMVDRARQEMASREAEVREASRVQIEQRMRLTHDQTEVTRLKALAARRERELNRRQQDAIASPDGSGALSVVSPTSGAPPGPLAGAAAWNSASGGGGYRAPTAGADHAAQNSGGGLPKPSPAAADGGKLFQPAADTSWAVPPPPFTPMPPFGGAAPPPSYPVSAAAPASVVGAGQQFYGGSTTAFRNELRLLREHQTRTQRYLTEQSRFLGAVSGDDDSASRLSSSFGSS